MAEAGEQGEEEGKQGALCGVCQGREEVYGSFEVLGTPHISGAAGDGRGGVRDGQ